MAKKKKRFVQPQRLPDTWGLFVADNGDAPDGWVEIQREDIVDDGPEGHDGGPRFEGDLEACFHVATLVGGCSIGLYGFVNDTDTESSPNKQDYGVEVLVIYDVDSYESVSAALDAYANETFGMRLSWRTVVPEWAAKKVGLV